MRKILLSIIILSFFVFPVFSVSYPNPTGYVNDFANLYSAGFRNNLEAKLSAFEKETGAEIAVVTIKSLEGMDIETYAVKLFEKWKIGKKGTDNGLLLLIAKEDRKIRFEVGYGLEPYITDGRAGEIIRNQMTPEFKKENYESGTLSAVEKIQEYISNKDIAPTGGSQKESSGSSDAIFTLVVIIIYIGITYIAGYLGRTKEVWPGGAIGAVIGAIGGFLVASIIGLVVGAIIFAPLGLLFDYILTKNYQVRKTKGLPTGFWHTWGGFGGGGGGGGGFGGFGGGSSGGGGASGGW